MVAINSQRAPFTVFGIVRFFKMNNFCLKLGFLQPSTLYPIFVSKIGVFSMRLFSNLFSSMPPLIFTRNETFCEHKGLLRVFGTIRLTGDLLPKISENFLPFLFWQVFGREYGFLLFPVEEKLFSSLMRIPSGIFWRCKIDEILTILSFCPWFSVWYCLFGFLFKSSQVFVKHDFASVL